MLWSVWCDINESCETCYLHALDTLLRLNKLRINLIILLVVDIKFAMVLVVFGSPNHWAIHWGCNLLPTKRNASFNSNQLTISQLNEIVFIIKCQNKIILGNPPYLRSRQNLISRRNAQKELHGQRVAFLTLFSYRFLLVLPFEYVEGG